MYLANFHDDVDTTNDAIVRGVLQSLGWPETHEVLAQAISAETKERLRRRGDEGFERGVFGAPTFLIGSELYWGNDRLEDALTSCVASS